MMEAIVRRLCELGFDATVVQLSHFGISDPVVEGFVATIYAREPAAATYVNTVLQNLTDNKPITPSPALYERPFWHSVDRASRPSSVPEEVNDHRVLRFIEHPLVVEGTADSPELVADYIKDFCQRVSLQLQQDGVAHQSNASDFVAVPFQRLESDAPQGARRHGNTDDSAGSHSVQGGVFFALGAFAAGLPDEEADKRLHSLRRDLDHAVVTTFVRQIATRDTELRQAALRRGSIHEVRWFAGQIESIARKQIATAPADPDAMKALAIEIKDSVVLMRKVADALNEAVDKDDSPCDLAKAFECACALVWFRVRHTLHTVSEYKDRHQDTGAVATFLAEHSRSIASLDAIAPDIKGNFGKCVIALKNLLDNAIKGCGDEWQDDRLLNFKQPRRFDLRVSKSADELVMANSAVLLDGTYDMSYTWTAEGNPRGFYDPLVGDVKTEFSLRGAKLAQVILELLGCSVRLKKVVDETGAIVTQTIVRRLGDLS
ncbi:MAG TPA: hypothetical protein VJM31_04340 [Vicinamibacterales bacterium]|nr:hypothetical protein [Vicinamibacterales bacterium]